jgi:hypothetical protein
MIDRQCAHGDRTRTMVCPLGKRHAHSSLLLGRVYTTAAWTCSYLSTCCGTLRTSFSRTLTRQLRFTGGMSALDTSSDSITKGKRYSQNQEGGWESLEKGSKFGSEEEEKEQREGGLEAWLTVAGSSLIYFATLGTTNSFGFFQNYYEHTFLQGVPASTISLVGTLQITLTNVLAAPAGALFDCYGLRVRTSAPTWLWVR